MPSWIYSPRCPSFWVDGAAIKVFVVFIAARRLQRRLDFMGNILNRPRISRARSLPSNRRKIWDELICYYVSCLMFFFWPCIKFMLFYIYLEELIFNMSICFGRNWFHKLSLCMFSAAFPQKCRLWWVAILFSHRSISGVANFSNNWWKFPH